MENTPSLASKTKAIVEHFEFKFNKNFGQNFLIDEGILNKIIEGSGVDADTHVIEIGPGIGTLTQELAKNAGKVTAIEIDPNLIEILKETLANYNNIEVINRDALKVDINEILEGSEFKKFKVVANLPYYITTPIIIKILTEWRMIDEITLMIQKEAGDRIMAGAGEEEYGPLAFFINYFSNASRVCKAAPVCFMPRPRVESVVINLDILEKPRATVKDEKMLFNLVKTSFNMRRKTLLNVAKSLGVPKDDLEKVFEMAGIDPKRRGETLTTEEFGKLADAITLCLSNL